MARKQTQAEVIAQAISILAPFNGGKVLEARLLLETITLKLANKATGGKTAGKSIRSKLVVGMEAAGIVDCYRLRIDTYRLADSDQRVEELDCIYCSKLIRHARASVVTNHWTRVENGKAAGEGNWTVSHGLAHVGCREGQIRGQIWAQYQAIEDRRLAGELIILNARLCDCGHTADHHLSDSNENLLACDVVIGADTANNPAKDGCHRPCGCDHFQQHKSQVAEQLPIVMEHDDDGNMIELYNEDYQESAQA